MCIGRNPTDTHFLTVRTYTLVNRSQRHPYLHPIPATIEGECVQVTRLLIHTSNPVGYTHPCRRMCTGRFSAPPGPIAVRPARTIAVQSTPLFTDRPTRLQATIPASRQGGGNLPIMLPLPRGFAFDPDALLIRLWSRTAVTPDGCYTWLGAKRKGYGRISIHRRNRSLHRVAYEFLRGPIPPGLEIDHLCRNRACWRPEHLEPVSHLVNIRRGVRVVDAEGNYLCKRGHLVTAGNLYWSPSRPNQSQCLECKRLGQQRRRLARRAVQERNIATLLKQLTEGR